MKTQSLLLQQLRIGVMDKKVRLQVQAIINNNKQSGTYFIELREEDGERSMSIIVGMPEAQSIAIAMEHITVPRPITHDLFVSLTEALGVKLQEVLIYKLENGVFCSELVFDKGGSTMRLDSRSSDAIAIALRVGCGIYTTEKLLTERDAVQWGLKSEEKEEPFEDEEPLEDEESKNIEDIKDEEELRRWLTALSSYSLEERLEKAVAEENYEHAKIYKDELQRRKEIEEAIRNARRNRNQC